MANKQNPGLVPDSDPEEEKKVLEELLKTPVGPSTPKCDSDVFSIQELTDSYKITGVSYGSGCYDLSKTLLENKTQNQHAEHALKAKSDEFCASNAPLIYALCKTLYENRDNTQYQAIIEKARAFLQKNFAKRWFNTLSRVKYNPNGKDEVVHDYKQKNQKTKSASLVGEDGRIIDTKTRAKDYVQALLDTTDDMKRVNDVFKWITGKDSYAWRLNNKPQKTEERVVALGVDYVDGFDLDADSGSIGDIGPAFGVRRTKKIP